MPEVDEYGLWGIDINFEMHESYLKYILFDYTCNGEYIVDDNVYSVEDSK